MSNPAQGKPLVIEKKEQTPSPNFLHNLRKPKNSNGKIKNLNPDKILADHRLYKTAFIIHNNFNRPGILPHCPVPGFLQFVPQTQNTSSRRQLSDAELYSTGKQKIDRSINGKKI